MEFTGQHILSMSDFDQASLTQVLNVAARCEPLANRNKRTSMLQGSILASLFFEPSTRTRLSFGAAFGRLGGQVLETTGTEDSSLAKGESLEDMARIVAGYADVIVMRHREIGSVQRFAASSNIPVINAGDGAGEHPTQALLDLYTICRETKRTLAEMGGLHIALVGDLKFGRTVHSLCAALCTLDPMRISLIAADAIALPESIRLQLEGHGHTVNVTSDLAAGLEHADVAYCTRVQQERFANAADANACRGQLRLDRALLSSINREDMIIMHPLPRDSRPDANELSTDLQSLPGFAPFRQADNGVAIRMALFALVLGVSDDVESHMQDVPWFVPDSWGTCCT